ncbi:beta-1,3-galactosyltransferase 6 [Drosophila kikkawai]|uniref:Hexosyltransferase n=1 Tax=Drosophila kikkawai TaxID=30033 RepID=A0A6P4JGT7_DROKI|nr:beta-1,3-galactosyltransferase 6 [Drosophila kikkawai]
MMRRMNNLVTLFTAASAFFFGSFITKILSTVDKCPTHRSGVGAQLEHHPDLFLIVLVLSSPRNVDHRNTMRSTWLRYVEQPLALPYFPEEQIYLPTYYANGHLMAERVESQRKRLRQYINWQGSISTRSSRKTQRGIRVKHFFAIGTGQMSRDLHAELQNEHMQHNDLLLLQKHPETYHNLTEKLLQSLDTLTQRYEFSYLIKVDDDTYVKLDSLLNELVSYDRKLLRNAVEYGNDPLPQLYWGYFSGRSKIKTKGRWKESNYYLSKNYLPYALGGGYVLSRKLCEYIANSSHMLSPYASEDVSVGTWLAPFRHIYRWHDPRFDTAYISRKCKPYHLVLHKCSQERMKKINDGKLCSTDTSPSSLPEYYYDWMKVADQCCDNLVE